MQAVYRGVVRPIHLALISWTGKVRFSIAEIVILTHTTQEKYIKAAIAEIEKLPNIYAPVVMIRMESFHIDN